MGLRLWIAAAVFAALALLPLAGQSFYLTLVSRMMIFALAATGLNLVLGYGAMVSFGHALYIGIGAYAVGMLSSAGVHNGWLQLLAALGIGGLAAALIGLVCLRASGVAFIMITLAFSQMFYFLVVSLKQYGGDDGLSIDARSDFGGFVELNDPVTLYYLIFALLVGLLFLFHRLVHSRFGMVLRGCKSNERRMRALGFPTLQVKLTAYVISALACVLAGVLLANLTRFASPSYMHWAVSGDLLVMVVLGGMGTLVGPVVGALLWLSMEEAASSLSLGWPAADELLHTHWLALLGLAALLVALKLKDGVYGVLVAREEKVQ
ncbi:branched-chain amino acid ABC transporter permease [Pelomonas sp. KK5]|uniref:branched-chain amino acid ABC transporter permease n=1 Tax=Pelomonas sp. KK5 TaxID=1855730 RepID=UPI00097BED3D|nr:branched-chain amino acid ABC transporter permease [Pelomonas sp. KK5]